LLPETLKHLLCQVLSRRARPKLRILKDFFDHPSAGT
jgi:hypothetical protein